MNRKISEFHLEQYLLGEAPDWVARAVEADPEAQARVRALEEENEAFFRTYPAEEIVASIEERLKDEKRQEAEREEQKLPDWAKVSPREEAAAEERPSLAELLRGFLAGLARRPVIAVGAAAALAVLVALPIFLSQTPEAAVDGQQDEYVRLKGLDPSLSIYRRSDSGEVRELSSGESASAGDSLQIAYNAAGTSHGTIFSVDGRGTVTLHFPASPFESSALQSGGEVSLPYSYVLDDAPRFERFFFVAASQEVDVAGLLNRVEELLESRGTEAIDAAEVGRFAATESDLDPDELGVETLTVSK
ncbi:MAG: hypothetical protein ACLFPP_10150 [Spirochaetaceae bacterium]